jgi:hypothetical membrane protein
MHRMGRIAFRSALLSLLLFSVTVVMGGASFPGYSHASQYISELGATGAPHSQAVSWLGFIPSGLLLMVFSFAAPMTLPRSPWTWVGFAFIAYYAFGLVAGGVFPCDFGCRPDDPSFSQVAHNLVAGTGYLTGITALLVLGIQARRWPGGGHLFPLGVVCWAVAALALPSLDPDFAYAGLAQRTIELCMYAWILACAFYLRRTTLQPTNQPSHTL